MPTYEYQCRACGVRHEQFQSMKDAPLKRCPSCGKRRLERLIGTGGAVIFKGSGFYQTDYRSESYKAAAAAEKPAESAPKSESAGGKESAPKPAAPAEPKAAEKPRAKSGRARR
jgi:putative FmdB family regulatory protein